MAEVHELTIFRFRSDVAEVIECDVMRRIGGYLAGCQGFRCRQCLRPVGEQGRWFERVVWANNEELEKAAALDDDPEIADLFDLFDGRDVVYWRRTLLARLYDSVPLAR
jgi:hypothetical protein